MAKNKLKKFSELETFQRVFQPPLEDVLDKKYHLRGRWAEKVFENSNPIVLELGCGKGEYTVGQAHIDPGRNFIGVDIKGARIWRGAKTANENNLKNVAFLRSRIEFIESFFGKEEIEEIWITFPDPQLKRRRNKKRLSGSIFLNHYRTFLIDKGLVHLKTDNKELYTYTKELVSYNKLEIIVATDDLYNSSHVNDVLSIKTSYEKLFLEEGAAITYISFRLPNDKIIIDLPSEND